MRIGEAYEIMCEARSVFGRKTTNKVYGSVTTANQAPKIGYAKIGDSTLAMRNDMAGLDDQAEDYQARSRQLQKAIDRNETRDQSSASKLRQNNPSCSSLYKRGKLMYERPDKSTAVGNCHEQSCVAAYLAKKRSWSTKVWIAIIEAPGDHVFCVVGPSAKPRWANVGAMAAAAKPKYLVIDPWMNFACPAKDYSGFAASRMNKWLAAGKRIYWKGSNSNQEGWYQPGGDYVARFLDSRLDFEQVKS